MKHRLSKRFEAFDSSAFRDVMQKKQSLTNAIDLSVGEPEGTTHHSIKSAGIKAIEQDKTRYAPANGLPELRQALAKKLETSNNLNHHADEISIVPGLTTGLLLVYMTILDPGDEVIVIDPAYPPYAQLASSLGAKVINLPSLPSFQLDISAIKANASDRTKAIIINSPNNPTGAVYPEEDLKKVADIADEYGFYVISDEIYEHFIYDGGHYSVGKYYPNTISMFGFSKQYSMTGWRLGYVSGPTDVIDAINELQQYAIFSSSSIAQHAAIQALSSGTDLLETYRPKRDLVVSGLREAGIEVNGAMGAYYAFFKAPNNMGDVEFTELLLEHNLILIPGRAFSVGRNFVRLSYGAEIAEVEKGMKVISKVVSMLK